MQNENFNGILTAIVTPFKLDSTIDYNAFKILIKRQIKTKISGIVVCGTTGEASTLKIFEKLKLIKIASIECKNKIKLITGASSNSTSEACMLQKKFEKLDIDATMHCVPWYNKPNQNGIYNHFKMINKTAKKPIFLYNVPNRCAVDIEPKTIIKLAKNCKNIVGIKDANTNPLRMQSYLCNLNKTRPNFKIFSGDDGFLLSLLAMGGHGLISTTSNFAPNIFLELYNSFKLGNLKKAQNIANKLTSLINLMFIETNPIPVKIALSAIKLIKPIFRLPIISINNKNYKIIFKKLNNLGWLKKEKQLF